MDHQHPDLENPLILNNVPIEIPRVTLPKKLLLLALVLTAILSYALVIIYTNTKPIESTITSVTLSSFNVSTTSSKMHGSWDVTLLLDKNVNNFWYEGRAWIFTEDEFDLIQVGKLNGKEPVVRGNFAAESGEDFRREDGLRVDLVIEMDAKFKSWWRRETFVTFSCKGLKIEFDKDDRNKTGMLKGGEKICQTRFYSSKFVDGGKGGLNSLPFGGWYYLWAMVKRIN